MKVKEYEVAAVIIAGGPWRALPNRAAIGRLLYPPVAERMIEMLREAGTDPAIIEAVNVIAKEPYEVMLGRNATSRPAEYRRNPTPEALGKR